MRSANPDLETAAAGRTISFCRICGKHTPHEWREGDGVVAKICISCVERDALYALDRD
jgi:hypothetical protein